MEGKAGTKVGNIHTTVIAPRQLTLVLMVLVLCTSVQNSEGPVNQHDQNSLYGIPHRNALKW